MKSTLNIKFNARKAVALFTPGIITGCVIGGYNVANIKRSPEYYDGMTLIDYTRFGLLIAIKSTLYGIVYPFALIKIALDINKKTMFESHFIPFSRYKVYKKT